MHDPEKSDSAVVAGKSPNKAGPPAAGAAEQRAGTKGNADQQSTHRTQTRERVTQALNRVRLAARQRKKERFTALLHHVNVDTLWTAFHALKRKAAAGPISASPSHTRGKSRSERWRRREARGDMIVVRYAD